MSLELAERISQVPQLYEAGTKSTAALLIDTGYMENRQSLSVEEVEVALRRAPQLAKLWLKRAKDQRLSGGWGLDCEGAQYRVQSYADGKYLLVRDRLRACAEFIVRYVGFIGDVLARRH
jgi:hypothetical protein